MNWVDIVGIAILVLLAYFGFRRGLIREAGILLAVLLAALLSFLLLPYGSRAVDRVGLLPPKLTPWIVALVSFVSLLLFFRILVHSLHKVVHATPLGVLDRIGGAGFGVLKGMVVTGLLLLILSFPPLPQSLRTQLRNSFLYSALSTIAPRLFWREREVSSGLHDSGRQTGQELRDSESNHPWKLTL